MKGGELASRLVIIALIIIWTIFQLKNSLFLELREHGQHRLLPGRGTGMLAVGLVFVLLLGEIDLSVASVSGLASAVFAEPGSPPTA